MVQQGLSDTCQPQYACARIGTPAPGMLYFSLTSLQRDPLTGEPLIDTRHHHTTMALLDRSRLKPTPCGVKDNTFLSALPGGCRIAVSSCDGDCDTLTVGFDPETCPESSNRNSNNPPFRIEKTHRCYARLEFSSEVTGVVARSTEGSGRGELCWVFSKSRLWITSAKNCNKHFVFSLKNKDAKETLMKYDPLNAISMSVSDSGGGVRRQQSDSSGAAMRLTFTSLYMLCQMLICTSFIMQVVL